VLVEVLVYCGERLGWSTAEQRRFRQRPYRVVVKRVEREQYLGRLRYSLPRMRTLKCCEILFEKCANSACDFGTKRLDPVAQGGREAGRIPRKNLETRWRESEAFTRGAFLQFDDSVTNAVRRNPHQFASALHRKARGAETVQQLTQAVRPGRSLRHLGEQETLKFRARYAPVTLRTQVKCDREQVRRRGRQFPRPESNSRDANDVQRNHASAEMGMTRESGAAVIDPSHEGPAR
jgi:hypothetical protein